MGGTIASFIDQGKSIGIIDLTNGEPTPYGTIEKRAKEQTEASKVLGVNVRETLAIKNREIFDTVENRKLVANTIRKYKPEILFIPYPEDGHPDHINASKLALASRFYAKLSNTDMQHDPWYPKKIFYFFSTHLQVKFQPSFIYDISNHFDTKIKAIKSYKSQFIENEKNKVIFDHVKNVNAYWGSQTGCKFGEPFVGIENLLLKKADTIL